MADGAGRSMAGQYSGYGADVAERLRRLTRNQLGSPRAGSSPAVCERAALFLLKAMIAHSQVSETTFGGMQARSTYSLTSRQWGQRAMTGRWNCARISTGR